MSSYDDLWQKIRYDLEHIFSEETFNDVFEPLKETLKYSNNHVYVLVPNEFIKNRMVNGSFIVIDDYFNIDQEGNSIRQEFKKHFDINKNVFKFSSYGLGGVVYQYIDN